MTSTDATMSVARIVALLAAAGLAMGCTEVVGSGPRDEYPQIAERSDTQLTQQEQLAYEEDAVRLAIRHLAETGSPARHDVNPPSGLVASLYSALVHVHAAAHPARDSIVDVYAIHTFPNPATREIMVRVNPAYPWTAAWKALQTETGEAAIDTLIAEHDLSVVRYHEWSIGEVAILRAARPLSIRALAARFEAVAGVVWAEPNAAIGDGNDIRAQVRGNGWRLDYSIGFGDCPAGCIHRYTWSFGVSAAGDVLFLGTSGQPPAP